jgi:hypothetical protein
MAAGKPNDSEYPPYEGLIDGASFCLLTLNNGEDGARHGSEESLAIHSRFHLSAAHNVT